MPIDLLTLRLLVAVVEEQSVAKAAGREHIAASAVSKRIADLEKTLKVQLFRRHRTGLQPTPAGHALLHHARVLMRDLAQMDSEIGDYAQGARGSIRVFANTSVMVQYLPGDLSRFLAEHPLIRVDLEEAISPLIVRAVADEVAEIGIYGGNIPAPGLTVLPYREDRLVVVVPPKHPLRGRSSVRLSAVLPYDLVGVQKGSSIDALVVKAAADLGRPMKLRIARRDSTRSAAWSTPGSGWPSCRSSWRTAIVRRSSSPPSPSGSRGPSALSICACGTWPRCPRQRGSSWST